jgi:3,4-dihydroxy-2-butanone 4-phosphate synthase
MAIKLTGADKAEVFKLLEAYEEATVRQGQAYAAVKLAEAAGVPPGGAVWDEYRARLVEASGYMTTLRYKLHGW